MSQLKYGRLAATRPFGLSDLSTYASGKLPKPPTSVDAPNGVNWGMDDNDQFGDCTIAGVDHLIAAWSADLNEPEARPSNDEISQTYFNLTGGQDTGLNEANVLSTWQSSGLFGNTIAAYAPINPRNLVELHQAIAFYRGAYLGIDCPQSAQTDFANGQPWTYDPSSPIEGGHCIVAVGYTPTAVLCVSWGAVVEVTYPFLAHFLEEAWCVLGQEIVARNGDGLGIDLASLRADLATV